MDPLAKSETALHNRGDQVQIEQPSSQTSLWFGPTTHESQIKAPEGPNHEISSRDTISQSSTESEKKKEVSETKKDDPDKVTLQKVKEGRDELKTMWYDLSQLFNFNWLSRIFWKKGKSGSAVIKGADSFVQKPANPVNPRQGLIPPYEPKPVQSRQEGARNWWSALFMGQNWDDQEVDALFTMPAEDGKREVASLISEDSGLMREAKATLKSQQKNIRKFVHLVNQFRSGDPNPGMGTGKVKGASPSLRELRGEPQIRVYFIEEDNIIKVVGISHKGNQNAVIAKLIRRYPG